MIYKIKTRAGEEILIENEKDLIEFVIAANNPDSRLIITKYGIPNVLNIDSITVHKEKNKEVMEVMKTLGRTKEEAVREVLGEPPFEFLKEELYKRMSISPQTRTQAQMEASKEERKLKSGNNEN